MAKFSEQTLTSWTLPPSETEQQKMENSEKMVRDAIANDPKLRQKSTETFAQGSYANDTNVRLNSDVDINVRHTGGFYSDLPAGKSREDFGIHVIDYNFTEYKNDVENALVNKFGRSDVIRCDKCLTIKGNSYRVETDVVPTWNFRRYSDSGSFVLGARFYSDSGKEIDNFPKQHIENGKQKNSATNRRFKRLTRIHRRLRYKMIDDGLPVNDSITSFLLECLVWNVPNNIFNDPQTWTDRLKLSVGHLYNNTTEHDKCKEWGEVSELLYLFYHGRKWNSADVNAYLLQLWKYLEY